MSYIKLPWQEALALAENTIKAVRRVRKAKDKKYVDLNKLPERKVGPFWRRRTLPAETVEEAAERLALTYDDDWAWDTFPSDVFQEYLDVANGILKLTPHKLDISISDEEMKLLLKPNEKFTIESRLTEYLEDDKEQTKEP